MEFWINRGQGQGMSVEAHEHLFLSGPEPVGIFLA